MLASPACSRGEPPAPAEAAAPAEVRRAEQGWMGRYSRREEALRDLLGGHPGWPQFRDMALFEAVQFFTASSDPAARVGAARAYLTLADLFAALDRVFLEVEGAYLEAAGRDVAPAARVRRSLVRLRRGEVEAAAAELEGTPPQGFEFLWSLGRAGVAAGEGRSEQARALLRGSAPRDDAERVLARVCCYQWGIPWEGSDRGAYGEALGAFQRGDLTGGVMALQMLDFASDGGGAEPSLFLYPMLRRAFAGLALAAAREAGPGAEAYLEAGAREHLGEYGAAAAAFARARRGADSTAPTGDAAWLFGPVLGPPEAARLAAVREGAALYREGRKADGLEVWRGVLADGDPGPLAVVTLAARQGEVGAAEPLGDAAKAADAAVAAVTAALSSWPEGEAGELLASLYPVRVAAVSRLAADVYARAGAAREAAETMVRAHRKSRGYRPDFVNPPAFLVDLARHQARIGEYAPAVAVLFELAEEYPSARVAYESLKRLYASRTGGEVPPR